MSDGRFERLRMEPVGAFTRDGDISAIHSLEQGLVYVDELPAFFALQRNEHFAHRPSAWVVNGLESLPRLDVVRTKVGHLFHGFLENPALEYRAPDRNHHHWEWREIARIYLEPSGFFSSHDKLRIQLRSGQTIQSSAVQGTVRILDLEGQRTEHALSNLAFIAPSRVRNL